MQDTIQQIAARIKELREISGVSLPSLAREFGVSVEQYGDYENGRADIPVGILAKLAHKFGVELSALIVGEDPRVHTYYLCRKGKGVSVERRRDYKYQSLAHNFAHKKAEPFLVTVEPDPPEAPIHFNSHPGQEFNYVLQGTLRIVLGGHELTLNEGDSLFFDSGLDHGMKALGGQPAKFLAVIL